MSSQSQASALSTATVVRSRASPSSANTRGVSPLSLWVHHTPRFTRPPASPDASVMSGVEMRGLARSFHVGQVPAPTGGAAVVVAAVVVVGAIEGVVLVGAVLVDTV